MRDILKGTVIALLSIIGLLVIIFAVQGESFFMYKLFAGRTEQVRREVFEQSKAYNQGMIQELQNMQFEYLKATKEQQAGLKSIILHRVADYDVNKLPTHLQAFVFQLRGDQ